MMVVDGKTYTREQGLRLMLEKKLDSQFVLTNSVNNGFTYDMLTPETTTDADIKELCDYLTQKHTNTLTWCRGKDTIFFQTLDYGYTRDHYYEDYEDDDKDYSGDYE